MRRWLRAARIPGVGLEALTPWALSVLADYPGPGAAKAAARAQRPAHRLSRGWALRVNWKILWAVGLALLIWALILAIALSLF